MTARSTRALTLGLLASTFLATPAFAQNVPPETATQPQTTGQSPAPGTNATDVTAPPPRVQQEQAARGVPDETAIIITATKREENLQNVPISVQVLGNRKLDQLNITNFEQYTKQLPSVTFQTAQPGFTTVYMRGRASPVRRARSTVPRARRAPSASSPTSPRSVSLPAAWTAS
jgi:iron complex outermembrane recepter protein